MCRCQERFLKYKQAIEWRWEEKNRQQSSSETQGNKSARTSTINLIQSELAARVLRIHGLLQSDDLDDDDERDEIASNIFELLGNYGRLESVAFVKQTVSDTVVTGSPSKYFVDVSFVAAEDAHSAAVSIDQIVMGGNTISVEVVSQSVANNSEVRVSGSS